MARASSNELTDALNRRHLLQTTAGGLAAFVFADRLSAAEDVADSQQPAKKEEKAGGKGRLKQSVSQWCFGGMSVAELARESAAMGIKSVELVGPGDWATLKEHGLICAMTPSTGIDKSFNDKANHAASIASVKKAIEDTAAAGFPNVVCLSGNRAKNLTDDEGLANCVEGLKQVVGLAEKKNVTLCLEVLNSRLDHRGYMGDTVEWCVEVCKRVGSPRMKILFDIYHVQVQQGDVISRIREFHQYVGHYHTAGVPGRHEMDETQELYYPAIMRAIAETGYQGYIGHEFIPTSEPMKKLREMVNLCDV
jgi:hydroxypyruvate isomerase